MPRRKSKVPLERVSLRLPSELIMRIDRLVEKGLFKSRSQLVKHALREMLKEPRFQEVLNEKEDDFPTLRGR
ncbi:ribbon-helix-helix domain-containing protein [Pyrobaculum sp.]|uniref:ribbon-helix-helix domain-containing protein n=1 Tax=Pyrobaculum sp. TaxID=2004705 RepID=UPI003D11A4AD